MSGAPGLALGNPTQSGYDLNVSGGGALVHDRLWVNGAVRRWIINKLVNAKNDDGTQAVDDNTLKNYSGKGVFSASSNQKMSFSYNWNNKIRGHRRDTPPNLVPDIASLVQTNPASSTQAKYTGIHNKTVFESSFSIMKGETDYDYQPNTPSTAVRVVDTTLDTARNAAQRAEQQPNSRLQFDNILSYSKPGMAGDHLFKGGVQFARLYYDDRYQVLNNYFLNYSNGAPINVQEFNTPTEAINVDKVLGIFGQDSWSVGRNLTLNLGVRFDHNTGTLPAQSTTGGPFIAARSIPESTPISQNIFVWRTGLSYDPWSDGKTAIKASASRYGLQVGIDRVLNVNPLQSASQTCPWTDPNKDGIAQSSEYGTGCSGFPSTTIRYAGANGPNWPYSDEFTAGIERELIKNMRVGVMYYHRTNRDQIGQRNTAATGSAYAPFTITVPNGPGGTLASPKPVTATVYNLLPAFNGLQANIVDNDPFLNTDYNGVEITAQKRFSQRWQMVTGFTVGKNTGGINAAGGQSVHRRSQRSQHRGLREGHRRQRLAVCVPSVGQLSRALRDPGGRHPRVEHRVSVHVDLLGDARGGRGGRRRADAVRSDDFPERSRRRTLPGGDPDRPAHLAHLPVRLTPHRADVRHLQPRQRVDGCRHDPWCWFDLPGAEQHRVAAHHEDRLQRQLLI